MTSPFDESKYETLLKGLEAREIKLSELERTARIDSLFYSNEYIALEKLLLSKKSTPLTDYVAVSDGNHMSISDYFTDANGVPYYRGQDIYNFFIEQSARPMLIELDAFNKPQMKRSHLHKGDVLMSIVGAIIGNLSLVSEEVNASCSCKLAILRPKEISPNLVAAYLKSSCGQSQIQRYKRGAAQTGLILEDFEQILMPQFSCELSRAIDTLIDMAKIAQDTSSQKYALAEKTLYQKTHYDSSVFNKAGISTKYYASSFGKSGRLDAEYYQPKFDDLIKHITSIPHRQLKTLVKVSKSIEPGSDAYAETNDGLPFLRVADYTKFDLFKPQQSLSDAFVSQNQNLLSKLKPTKGTILFSKDGSVGEAYCLKKDADFITSGAILHLSIIDTNDVIPEYLALALNSEMVRMQAERDAGGSIILHWRQNEIEDIVVPLLPLDDQKEIASLMDECFEHRLRADELIQAAQSAIDIAIEESEISALKFVEKFTKT